MGYVFTVPFFCLFCRLCFPLFLHFGLISRFVTPCAGFQFGANVCCGIADCLAVDSSCVCDAVSL